MAYSNQGFPDDVNTVPAEDGTTWVEIASTGTEDEAQLLSGFLQAEGIRAQVESLKIDAAPINFGSMGDIRVFPAEFEDIGDVCNATGQFEQAARLYGAASALRARIDTPIPWWFEAEYRQELERSRTGLSPDRFAAAWDDGQALTIEEALEEALAVRIAARPEAHEGANPFDLTAREMEVLRHLSDGASNSEIATALFISPKTAANHVANILSKLGADSRTAAASIALRHKIV